MKIRILGILLLGFLLLFPSLASSQPDRGERSHGAKRPSDDLRVLQLDMNPDPVVQGQWVRFRAVISNSSRHSGRVSIFIKDRDEVVATVEEVDLKPGENRIMFPQTRYRFNRQDSCFTVEVDIERSRRPVDLAEEFCARKTLLGWSMKTPRIGPLFVEDLDTLPDPVIPGQEIGFRAKLRNDGRPLRVDLRIQDRDQVVTRLDDVPLPRGSSVFVFPHTRYQFQRFDHCFTVIVDVEKTPYRVDATREFCARPLGWTLRP